MRNNGMLVLFGIIVGVFVLGGIGFSIASATHVTERTCTVTGKDRTTKTDSQGNSSSDARVYTSDCGTLRVGDSLLSWTFSSSDTYGRIEEGKRYDFKMRGYRVPLFSMFPNVVEAVEVK